MKRINKIRSGPPDRIVRCTIYVRRLFPMYATMLIVDALRVANFYLNRGMFHWDITSDSAASSIESSNGFHLPLDCGKQTDAADFLFVVAGDDVRIDKQQRDLSRLRRLVRAAKTVVAVDSGLFLIEAIGATDDDSGSVHPLSVKAFAELTGLDASPRDVQMDGRLWSAPGGVRTTDLMLSIVGAECGPLVRELVRRDMSAALPGGYADVSLSERLFRDACRTMQTTVENPLTLEELAHDLGTSPRQLNRAFNERVGVAPMQFYLLERLLVARQIMLQTRLPLSHVAFATGFHSQSAFSRAFRQMFGVSSRELVARMQEVGNDYFLPAGTRTPLASQDRDHSDNIDSVPSGRSA